MRRQYYSTVRVNAARPHSPKWFTPEYLSSGVASLDSQGRSWSPSSSGIEVYAYFIFDDVVARGAAELDPLGFVADLPARVILDKVKKVPALFAPLKLEVDRKRVPGRLLLTGSSNVLHTLAFSDSLAGRMETVRLHPLAQCELPNSLPSSATVNRPYSFLDNIFQIGFEIGWTERLGVQFNERIVAGGYPAALARSDSRLGIAITLTPKCSGTCQI